MTTAARSALRCRGAGREAPSRLRPINAKFYSLNVRHSPSSSAAEAVDKPKVTLEPAADPDRVSGLLNIRVADIAAMYRLWSARGATFLTLPIDRGREIRC